MSSPITSGRDVIDASLVALSLLADPTSVFLSRGRLRAIAAIALRDEPAAARAELALLHDSARDLSWLRPALKRVIIALRQTGVIDDLTTQRIVDYFEVWSD
jgi:hypothetical protein